MSPIASFTNQLLSAITRSYTAPTAGPGGIEQVCTRMGAKRRGSVSHTHHIEEEHEASSAHASYHTRTCGQSPHTRIPYIHDPSGHARTTGTPAPQARPPHALPVRGRRHANADHYSTHEHHPHHGLHGNVPAQRMPGHDQGTCQGRPPPTARWRPAWPPRSAACLWWRVRGLPNELVSKAQSSAEGTSLIRRTSLFKSIIIAPSLKVIIIAPSLKVL